LVTTGHAQTDRIPPDRAGIRDSDKGKVRRNSAFWFARTQDIVPNHLITMDVQAYPGDLAQHADLLAGRSMLVRKTTPVPIECVARGYLSGSGWKEYVATGSVCGVALPPGLRESDRLPSPIFTPATKAESGHDINISEAEAGRLIGTELTARLRDLTLALYGHGVRHAEAHGIILADTKFEFGLLDGGDVILIDEVLTPDSSRYWPKDQYKPGGPQPSFDKQFVRDYLEEIHWNKQPPVPSLPDTVVIRTREKYLEAFTRLTGTTLR
jgi:phosphoribosylaminoimidazole-succinocarboxamide synthase